MRVALFTDTLFDVNGVSRFILNVAETALAAGRELHVLTSTRFPCPPGLRGDHPTIHNIPPRLATRMPGYANLDVVWPPRRALLDLAERLRPDAVHVSTPGPVGALGRRYALRHGLPLLGTYHTDFPAYVDHLFDDAALTWVCTAAMRRFYRPFRTIFTRSADYADALVRLGIPRGRIVRLLPGIRTDTFHTRHRPADLAAFWRAYPGVDPRPDTTRVLYVGRVSVEKNLPMLTRIWKALAQRLPPGAAQLIVVGDGPYRARMEAELADTPGGRGGFLGFRHGPELSAIYAACDIFIFPSTTDTLGQVVMEAQSAGLPVLVTDRGGPAEVVRAEPGPDQTGYVLPATSITPWLETLLHLITNPAHRRALGAAAHRAIQPMSIRHSFDHFWSVHEAAISPPPRPTISITPAAESPSTPAVPTPTP